MCGISGIIGNSNSLASEEVYKTLVAMGNRGRNSSGITSYDSSTGLFHSYKDVGSAEVVFRNYDFGNLAGQAAIGHNRYSTAGKVEEKNLRRDAQPHQVPKPGITLAHNGNILNIISLKKRLAKESWSFDTDCDAVYLLYLLADNLNEVRMSEAENSKDFFEEKLVPSLEKLTNQVIGAYSFVSIIDGWGMIGMRDPHGIRPLSYGQRFKGNSSSYCFASERTALNIIKDYENIKDVQRGEVIFIDFALNKFSKIIRQEKPSFCSFEPVYFSEVDSVHEGKYVYDSRYALGLELASQFKELASKIDIVTPVPATPTPAAEALAKAWGKEYGGIVKRQGVKTRAFQEPTKEKRLETIDKKYIFIKSRIKGKSIAVVDDSIVRADTSKAVVKKLRELGAKAVYFLSTYPPYRNPCVYGIDTPEKKELIAYTKKTIKGIQNHIKVDGLFYLPKKNMLKAVNLSKETACTACIDGCYPTDISEYERYQELRAKERKK